MPQAENVPLLDSHLPPSELQHHLLRLPAGTVIHRYGSPCRGILFVKEGTVQISLVHKDGSETVFDVGPGGAVGLTAAMGGSKHEFSATVKQPVLGVYMPAGDLGDWLRADPQNYVSVLQMLSQWDSIALGLLRTTKPRKPRVPRV